MEDFTAGALIASTFSTIDAASGRIGSKMYVMPSSGLGEKPRDPDTIDNATASPSARAQASTAAATMAGRDARTDTDQIASQRLAPSAEAPSVHATGIAPSASTTMAIMIGVIITVSTTIATRTPVPSSWTTFCTDALRPWLMRWLPTN